MATSAEQVQQYYQNYLGRSATAAEASYWVNTGGAPADIGKTIQTSPEAQQKVQGFYQAYLGRTPDASETSYWTNTGGSVKDIGAAIQSSSESQQRFAAQQQAKAPAPAPTPTPTPTPTPSPTPTPTPTPKPNQDFEAQFGAIRGAYESQIGSLKETLSGYQSRLDTAQSDFSSKLSEYQKQLNEARSTYEGNLKQRDADLVQAKTMAESYKSDAARYQDLSIQGQMQGLRSGVTATSTSPAASGGDLRSGGNRGRSSSGGTLVDVRASIDATDSVLNRRTPVVETINTARRPRQAAAPARSLASGGTSSRYYASRFG